MSKINIKVEDDETTRFIDGAGWPILLQTFFEILVGFGYGLPDSPENLVAKLDYPDNDNTNI